MTAGEIPAVLVMAKPPRPGTVKTRLHPSPSSQLRSNTGYPILGPERCSVLRAELIRHTVRTTTAAGYATYLAYAPDDAPDAYGMRTSGPNGVHLLRQHGSYLGERLQTAAREVFARRPGPLVILGTDAPTLTDAHLADAFAALDRGRDDAVLGPALDGGYYLIGMRAPHLGLFGINPELWGGDRVLDATLAVARASGLSAELLAPLRDLDTPEDAERLRRDPRIPSRIAHLLVSPEAEAADA